MKCMSHDRRSESRRALTLVEMLVGMAITLIMMAAVVNLFANVSGGVSNRRAAIEMNGTLRQARSLLQRDLAGATCPAVPWQNPEAGNGYLEIIEGQWSDSNPSELTNDPGDNNAPSGDPELDYTTSIIPGSQRGNEALVAGSITDGGGLGDYDDILALTVRSDGEPFVGQWFNPNFGTTGRLETIESNLAEVIWYAVENPSDGSLGEPGLRTIYRRVLLIAPWLSGTLEDAFGGDLATAALLFNSQNDISVRRESNPASTTGFSWVPNTLSDLTKRENRFAHYRNPGGGYGFPFHMDQRALRQLSYEVGNTLGVTAPPDQSLGPLRPFGIKFNNSIATNSREGEDVILNDVLAWDVRAFDPGAPQVVTNNTVLEPSDIGWYRPNALNDIVGFGSFVDPGWVDRDKDAIIPPAETFNFAGVPQPIFALPVNSNHALGYPCVYDTWSTHYESDGLDQDDTVNNDNIPDGDPTTGDIDEGTDGFDNDGFNGTDDVGERETSPPYDVKLPAVKVIMRAYERDSRQIRETSVTQSFQ